MLAVSEDKAATLMGINVKWYDCRYLCHRFLPGCDCMRFCSAYPSPDTTASHCIYAGYQSIIVAAVSGGIISGAMIGGTCLSNRKSGESLYLFPSWLDAIVFSVLIS